MSETLQMSYLSMASSIGIAMQNASTIQHYGQTIGNTGMTIICSMIIAKGASS